VASGSNEIETHMDASVVVAEERTLDLQFFLEIGLKLSIYVVNY
jgi:hypothetical protein